MERWIYDNFMAFEVKERIENKHKNVDGALDLNKKEINTLTKQIVNAPSKSNDGTKKKAQEAALGSKCFATIYDNELEKQMDTKDAKTPSDADYAKILDENDRLKLELGSLRRQTFQKANQGHTDDRVSHNC